jgi:hypothetical protein
VLTAARCCAKAQNIRFRSTARRARHRPFPGTARSTPSWRRRSARTWRSTRHGDATARHAALVDARIAFLPDLHATPDFEGEKIDVVLLAPALGAARQPIHEVALATGVEL